MTRRGAHSSWRHSRSTNPHCRSCRWRWCHWWIQNRWEEQKQDYLCPPFPVPALPEQPPGSACSGQGLPLWPLDRYEIRRRATANIPVLAYAIWRSMATGTANLPSLLAPVCYFSSVLHALTLLAELQFPLTIIQPVGLELPGPAEAGGGKPHAASTSVVE